MKTSILFLFLLSNFIFGYSQKCMHKAGNGKKSPEKIAQKRADHLEEILGLSKDQKEDVYKVLLQKAKKSQVIKEKYQPDIKKMKEEIKAVKERYKPTMEALKKEMKEIKQNEKEKFEKILTKEQLEKAQHIRKKNKRVRKIKKRKRAVNRKHELWMKDEKPQPNIED